MNKLITDAAHIPVGKGQAAISISRVTVPFPGRNVPLEVRITAPVNGTSLPIVLLSHGHGPSTYIPSKDGYGPLVDFYAEHGFAVIQPTHANSKYAGFVPDAPGGPLFIESRAKDMTAILDNLEAIESQVSFLAGRLDRGKVAVVGHSLGGVTAGHLLGAKFNDPEKDIAGVDLSDARVKVGVLLGAPGRGYDNLLEGPRKNYSAVFHSSLNTLTTRTLVVVGDQDVAPHFLVNPRAEWHADVYNDGPGADCLLTLHDGGHGFGGIAGWNAKETDDEDPERLAVTLRMTWAYIRSALYPEDRAWTNACSALKEKCSQHGHVDSKN